MAILVVPVGAYLAHNECVITGEVLNAAGGYISRMVMVNTTGINEPNLTSKTIAERLEEVTGTNERPARRPSDPFSIRREAVAGVGPDATRTRGEARTISVGGASLD